jgi:N-methylhydantoinase A
LAVEAADGPATQRTVYFSETGQVNADIWRLEALAPGVVIAGPAVIESSFTTIVVNPGASARRAGSGSLVITLHAQETSAAVEASSQAVS